jgi:hypothetical protein
MPNTNDDDTDERDPEELLQQSQEQKRHTTEPNSTPTETAEDSGQSLEAAIADAYAAMDAGDLHENLTVRDANMAALIAGLQATGQLEEIGDRANERLDRDFDVDTVAGFLKAILRVGLEDIAPETLEAVEEGYQQYQQDEFQV